MYKEIVVFLGMAISSVAAADLAPQSMTKFNVECPAPKLLPMLDMAYHDCGHRAFKTDKPCSDFVEYFRQLLPVSDCQRSFDSSPNGNYIVPAIWLAGDGALEDYVEFLSKLPTPEAKQLFGSAEFRKVLDGALAEEVIPLSLKVEKELQKKGAKHI